MRIGILTFHNSRNFGANLQTLATQEMLRNLGHEPVIVNYEDEAKLAILDKMNAPDQIAMHEGFAARYYNLSPLLRAPDEVAEYCRENLDGVVTGSDAVFRLAAPYQPKRIIKKVLGRTNPFEALSWSDHVPPFFLPFEAPGVIKGAIAASSRGTPFYYLKPNVMRAVGRALRDFDFVTVRDDWTGKMVRGLSLGQTRPLCSPDPVFGLNSAFTIPDEEKPIEDLSRTILLTGDFERDWLKRLVAAIHAHGLQAVTLANPHEKDGHDFVDGKLGLPMSPLRWYASLASCAGFIGMRFHGYVSCLANRTPVVTMDVAKPAWGHHDPRNPNYDLARRAGIERNYFIRRDLMRADPDDVMTRLFDPATRAKADAFAARAPGLLYEHLQRFETINAQQRG